MTVNVETPIAVYTPTGTAVGPFSTVWTYDAPQDIKVVIETDGSEASPLTVGSGFTVLSTAHPDGGFTGAVTLDAGAVPYGGWQAGDSAHRLLIRRATVLEQAAPFGQVEGFRPPVAEAAYDKLTRAVQDVKSTASRAVLAPVGETPLTQAQLLELASANAEAGLNLGSMATQNASGVSIAGGTVLGLSGLGVGTASPFGTPTVRSTTVQGEDGGFFYARNDSQTERAAFGVFDGEAILTAVDDLPLIFKQNDEEVGRFALGGGFEVRERGATRANLNGGVEIRVDDFLGPVYLTDVDKINAAFAYLRDQTFYMGAYGAVLVFSARAYEITASIDATMINQGPWSVVANGAIFLGTCAGKAMFDLLGSRFLSWQGGFMLGDNASKPWCAVQIGRVGDGVANCDCMSFTNVHAWGYYVKAAKVNIASETSTDDNCRWWNQNTASTATALIFDGYNYFNAPSDHVTPPTPGTYMSNIQHTLTSPDVRKDGAGEAIWGIGLQQFDIQNGYAACAGNAAICLFTDSAADPLGTGTLRWNIDLHVETNALEYLLDIRQGYGTTQLITDLTWREMGCQVTQAVLHAGTGITAVTINDADIKVSDQLTDLVSGLAAPGGVFTITGRLAMNPANLANVTFNGELICAGTVTQGPGSIRMVNKGVTALASNSFPFVAQSYGLFDNFGRAAHRLIISDTDAADGQPRLGHHIQMYSAGAGLGGGYPPNSRIAYSALLHKGLSAAEWLTNNTPGQMDGYQCIVRQGVGDSGAFLHQGRFREGYMATLEGNTTRVNASDVAQQSVTVQAGTIDQVSGHMAGYLARVETGVGLRGYSVTAAASASWTFPFYYEDGSSAGRFSVDTNGNLAAAGYVRPGSYTVATVPSAAASGAGAQIFVSNEAGGSVIAFSDGAAWRRVTDRAVIS